METNPTTADVTMNSDDIAYDGGINDAALKAA